MTNRPIHCHGHSTTLIIPDITKEDRKLNNKLANSVPCPHLGCSGLNRPGKVKCSTCRRKVNPTQAQIRRGETEIKIKAKAPPAQWCFCPACGKRTGITKDGNIAAHLRKGGIQCQASGKTYGKNKGLSSPTVSGN